MRNKFSWVDMLLDGVKVSFVDLLRQIFGQKNRCLFVASMVCVNNIQEVAF